MPFDQSDPFNGRYNKEPTPQDDAEFERAMRGQNPPPEPQPPKKTPTPRSNGQRNGDVDLSRFIGFEPEREMLALIAAHCDVLEERGVNGELFGDWTNQKIFEFFLKYFTDKPGLWNPANLIAQAKRSPKFWDSVDAPERFVPLFGCLVVRENFEFVFERLRLWRAKRELVLQCQYILGRLEADSHDDIDAAQLAQQLCDNIARTSRAPNASNGLQGAVDMATRALNGASILVGNRWLSRKSCAIIDAPTESGKSILAVQLAVMWGLGSHVFGIRAAFPLRILYVQAEDTDDDMTEMLGMLRRLDLTEKQLAMLNENVKPVWLNGLYGSQLFLQLRKYVRHLNGRLDLLILNPLSAYTGSDPRDAQTNAEFLRTELTAFMEEFDCGTLLVAHTPKTQYQQYEKFKAKDWAYAMAGDAGISNYARAILHLQHTDDPETYRLIAAKRGSRLGWEKGTREIFISHSGQNDCPMWVLSSAEQITKATGTAKADGQRAKTLAFNRQKLLSLIPLIGDPVPRGHLKVETGFSNETLKDLLDSLIHDGSIEVVPLRTSKGQTAKCFLQLSNPKGIGQKE